MNNYSVSISTLKRELRISRAATFRHFLNGFSIDGVCNREEFAAATRVSYELAQFFRQIRFFLKDFEIDYYEDKTPKIIADRVNRTESEIINYLKINSPSLFSNGTYQTPKDRPLRYYSSYLIDKKLGGNYDFVRILREATLQNV